MNLTVLQAALGAATSSGVQKRSPDQLNYSSARCCGRGQCTAAPVPALPCIRSSEFRYLLRNLTYR
jgi:hypothetical protein